MKVNWSFLSQNEAQDIFRNVIPSEKRYRCKTFPGTITLDNDDQIPIEVIQHCYEKNRYIIISKNYDIEGLIGDIKTDKFNFIEEE